MTKNLTPRQQLLSELASALTDHAAADMGNSYFVDLTDGTVTYIFGEFKLSDVSPEELQSYPDWQQEQIRAFSEHELIKIDPVPSSQSFHIMEAFTETCNPQQQAQLYRALGRKHPFSNFRSVVDCLGLLQRWYDFKQKAEDCMAERWLHYSDLTIEDGKIVPLPSRDLEEFDEDDAAD